MSSRDAGIAVVCAAFALPLIALPAVAHDAAATATVTATKAFSRCTRDLADHLALRVVRSHYTPGYADPLGVLVRPQKLELTVRNAYSHRVVAQAECTYDAAGHVLGITPQPPGTPPALH